MKTKPSDKIKKLKETMKKDMLENEPVSKKKIKRMMEDYVNS